MHPKSTLEKINRLWSATLLVVLATIFFSLLTTLDDPNQWSLLIFLFDLFFILPLTLIAVSGLLAKKECPSKGNILLYSSLALLFIEQILALGFVDTEFIIAPIITLGLFITSIILKNKPTIRTLVLNIAITPPAFFLILALIDAYPHMT